MKEKEIIRSLPYTGKVIMIILLIIGVLSTIGTITTTYSGLCDMYEYHEHYGWCYRSGHRGEEAYLECEYSQYDSAQEYAMDMGMETYIGAPIAFIVFPMIWCLILRLLLKTFGMVVTDKRIYGWSIFQLWRTDLPLDMIQSVSKVGFTGIMVRSAGGAIFLLLIRNRKALHEAICNLMIQRNTKPEPAEIPAAPVPAAAVESREETPDPKQELQRYKEMLDEGLINQEDYDSKKKQILDL